MHLSSLLLLFVTLLGLCSFHCIEGLPAGLRGTEENVNKEEEVVEVNAQDGQRQRQLAGCGGPLKDQKKNPRCKEFMGNQQVGSESIESADSFDKSFESADSFSISQDENENGEPLSNWEKWKRHQTRYQNDQQMQQWKEEGLSRWERHKRLNSNGYPTTAELKAQGLDTWWQRHQARQTGTTVGQAWRNYRQGRAQRDVFRGNQRYFNRAQSAPDIRRPTPRNQYHNGRPVQRRPRSFAGTGTGQRHPRYGHGGRGQGRYGRSGGNPRPRGPQRTKSQYIAQLRAQNAKNARNDGLAPGGGKH